ncbi:MAG: hypothetical protein LAKADJCE_00470 [Candidatus Argoarchaeum ethanivorans]|uniref:Uncharacterized protein n=1 Tax=Candidatus Argoarchaeum ethanivorans TaxID=2608793 RepID=A0A811T768_9EURY|nr:MAG: hypothetical protein LAKADJCE_00470 [Candidatus Argoarchaeum ethanivorans]
MSKTKTLHAVFDGAVLKPEGPVDLEWNTRYLLTVVRTFGAKVPRDEPPYPLTKIVEIATDMGVDDLSIRHDWYAHGRRNDETVRGSDSGETC